jgi:small-conductance mechanosensitive channel
MVAQSTYYVILTLGLVTAMSAGGINPQSVVTGLGLTVALGFALKDIVSRRVATIPPSRISDLAIG